MLKWVNFFEVWLHRAYYHIHLSYCYAHWIPPGISILPKPLMMMNGIMIWWLSNCCITIFPPHRAINYTRKYMIELASLDDNTTTTTGAEKEEQKEEEEELLHTDTPVWSYHKSSVWHVTIMMKVYYKRYLIYIIIGLGPFWWLLIK